MSLQSCSHQRSGKKKIVEAGGNPTSKVAKEVLSTVIPVLNFGNGEKNIMGSLGDSSALSRAIAMMHRYGSELPIVGVCVMDGQV